jgi:hypothetical protein
MIDYNNLIQEPNIQVFNAQNSNIFQTWQKPRGCKFVNFFVIGAGGGGGSGGNWSIGNNSVGGGGGGSGGIYNTIIPSMYLPDTLYIMVGLGGFGGGSNGVTANGGTGGATYISTSGNLSNLNQGLFMSMGGGVGGRLPAGQAAGTNGSGIYRWLGLHTVYNGVGGANGGSGSTGNSQLISNILSGGAGGGGNDNTGLSFSGGSVIGSGFVPTIFGSQTSTIAGQNGFTSIIPSQLLLNNNSPLFFTGGAGGAASSVSTGGRGGNAAIGCGGGGGGSGPIGAVGAGGRGGNGLVIITCW